MEGKPSKGSNLEPNKSIKEVSNCKSGGKPCGKGVDESNVLSGSNQFLPNATQQVKTSKGKTKVLEGHVTTRRKSIGEK